MTRPHPAIGIDLGTTNSAVAFVDATGRPEPVRNAEGGLSTPSVIFFDRANPVIGSEALEAGVEEPDRLAMYAKRDVGEQVFRNAICGAKLPPEVLQALILGKLKEDAELKLGEIKKAVITVPAFFNEPCRKATQDAGKLAGLEVLDIINEPTAAAICYGVQQGFLSPEGSTSQKERILVYDLGGGTFDVTVMEIENRKYHTIATNGDVYLGGVDWDRRVVDFIAEAWIKEHGDDLREDPVAEQLLLRKANQVKHALTQRESVPIAFAYQGQRVRPDMDRETFKSLTEDLLERTLMTVELVLDEASISWSDLSRLILVGGSTRMPMIRDELSRLSHLEIDRSLSPDEAVAHGAAIYAGIRLGQESDSFAGVSVTNVNSHDLGVLAVDPETGEPRRQVMIKRNTALPARKSIRFRTHAKGQRNVKVAVVEGGDDRGRNATNIGQCLVDDLPKGTPKGTFVDVVFDYSQDGRLTVSANLPALNHAAEMKLDRAAGMSEDVLEKWLSLMKAGITEETLAGEAEVSADKEKSELEVLELYDDDDDDDETDEAKEVQEDAGSGFPNLKLDGAASPPISTQSDKATKAGRPKSDAHPSKDTASPKVVAERVGDASAAPKRDEKSAKRKLKRKVASDSKFVVSPPPLPNKVSNETRSTDKAEELLPSGLADLVAGKSLTQTEVPTAAKSTVDSSPGSSPAKPDLTKAEKAKSSTVTKASGFPDFGELEKLSEPQVKADGSALDAFFSNQNAPSGGVPAPAINISVSQAPKKSKRGGNAKRKGREDGAEDGK
jgi:molecular chaperone DnaK